MKQLTTAFAFLAFVASAFSQAGENLITNGDFNGLAPWTATGPVTLPAAGSGVILEGGTPEGSEVAQTVVTTADAVYYLSLQVTESSVAAEGDANLWLLTRNGGPPFGVSDYVTDVVKPGHYGRVFKATGTETIIRIGVTNAEARIANVSLVELPVSPHAGSYVGVGKVTVQVGLKGPDANNLTARTTQRVVARVLATGQFMILRDTEEVATGLLFPNGDFSLRADGRRMIGRAEISGKRLKLTATSSYSDDGGRKTRDEGQAALIGGREIEFTLTRNRR